MRHGVIVVSVMKSRTNLHQDQDAARTIHYENRYSATQAQVPSLASALIPDAPLGIRMAGDLRVKQDENNVIGCINFPKRAARETHATHDPIKGGQYGLTKNTIELSMDERGH
ncbi:hypothetical protein E2C01_060507 [Portunus trituberculatus]|uniref:Uncharacterized protein n=1 Tax=Portunus trituberculatus TaxID=210409 RepID=A0A5B7H2P7_PORTR|nr:hypothetical protein [Portunus trituberculatus]